MRDSNDPTIFSGTYTHLRHLTLITSELIKKIKVEEIIEDLDQFGVQISPTAFDEPTGDQSLGLYSLAIHVVFGKTDSDIRPEELYGKLVKTSSKFQGVDFSNENVDFLKSGIKNLRLWRYCQKLHSVLGLKDIELYELFNPTPRSFRNLISAFLLYLRFTDALYTLFEVSVSNLDSLAEKETRLVSDLEGLLDENDKFLKLMSDNLDKNESLLTRKTDLESRVLRANEEFTNLKNLKKELDLEVGKAKKLLNDTLLSKSKAIYTFDELSEHFTTNVETATNIYNDLKSEEESHLQRLDLLTSKVEALKSKYSSLFSSFVVFDRLKRNLSDHYRDVVLPHVDNFVFSKGASSQLDKVSQRISDLSRSRDSLISEIELKRKSQEEILAKIRQESQLRIDQATSLASDSQKSNEIIQKKISDVRDLIFQVNQRVISTCDNSRSLFLKLDDLFSTLTDPVNFYNERVNSINSQISDFSFNI